MAKKKIISLLFLLVLIGAAFLLQQKFALKEFLLEKLPLEKFSFKKKEEISVSQVPSEPKKKKTSQTPEEVLPSLEVRRVKGPVSWGRDPFLSPLVKRVSGEGAPKPASLTLSGVVRNAKGIQAIIGNYVVTVGDIINGKKVISIKENEVILMKGKDKEVLQLKEE